jgi:type IV secretory pathway VirB10-like protein
MGSSRLAFAAVGLACVVAAGAGSYLATRHNVADGAATSVAAREPSAQTATATAPAPVQETEGLVGEPSSSSAPAPAAPSAAAPATAPRARSAAAPRSTSTSQGNAAARQPARRAPNAAPAPQARAEQPPALDRSWPSADPSAPNAPADPSPAHIDDRAADTTRASEPSPSSEPTLDELTVAADSVIGLETETALSSERARVEDRVEARVARDVRVDGRVAIPAGTRALGSVVVVERGGKLKDRARLGIRFHTLALADGTRLPITTETIYRYGDAPGNGSAAKIGGGAVAGAILGAIIGGGKGAAIGATAGAAGGGATVAAGDRSEAVFPSGAQVTARILSPVTVTLDR